MSNMICGMFLNIGSSANLGAAFPPQPPMTKDKLATQCQLTLNPKPP